MADKTDEITGKFAPDSYFDEKKKWALIVIDIIKISASFYYFFAMLFMC